MRFRYYDGAGGLSETATTEAAVKSAEFLAALNDTAGTIRGAKAWRAGTDGYPTIAKAGLRDYYTVTFASARTTYETRSVPDGTAVDAPLEPSRHGYTFLWWYADDEDTPYRFDTPVTGALTLNARWDAHSYRVLFDSMGGSYVYPQAVRQDAPVTEPEPPARKGWLFDGWFSDEACTDAWNFGDGAQGDMTLYAGWRAASGVTLSGRITDAVTGEAVNGASVALSNGQNALSDEFGYYRIYNVEEGSYTITVTANGYVDETTGGYTVGGASAGFDAALTPDEDGANNTVTVYATVSCVYSALMLRGVTVEAAGTDGQGRALGPFTGVTDDKGNVSFVRIPSGKYTFTINRTGRPGWESYTSAQTEMLSGHYNLECALKPNYQKLTVSVTGYDPVRDEDNVPLANKRVKLTGIDPGNRTKKLCLVNMTTDENGTVVFEHAVPITWEVVCEDTNYQTASETVYATADGKLTKNAVALRPAFISAAVTVKLTTPYPDPDIFKNKTIGRGRLDAGFSDDGREKLGVQLLGTPGTQTAGIVREAELNDEGKALFERLPSGNYTLTASGSAKQSPAPVFFSTHTTLLRVPGHFTESAGMPPQSATPALLTMAQSP